MLHVPKTYVKFVVSVFLCVCSPTQRIKEGKKSFGPEHLCGRAIQQFVFSVFVSMVPHFTQVVYLQYARNLS